MDLSGKTIVLTGASSGIGEAAARVLAARGAKLILIARREEALQQLCGDIRQQGGLADFVAADLSDETALAACADRILSEHGPVDILINNAGRSIRRPVHEALDRYHDYQRTIQLNYLAAVNLTLRLLPQMLERGSGHIINISSMSALLPMPRYSAYVGSKSALDGFSRSLATEMLDHGIAVTTINFPLVRTPMSSQTDLYQGVNMMSSEEAAGWILRAIEKRPLRMATALAAGWATITALLPGPTTRITRRLFNFLKRRLQARQAQKA